jgi:hypothetical protein
VDGLNLFAFVKNQPIKWIDMDGRGARYRELPQRGVRPARRFFSIDAVLINHTTTVFTQGQLRAYARRIERQFRQSYSVANVTASVRIRISNYQGLNVHLAKIRRHEHVIRIVPRGGIPDRVGNMGILGRGLFHQNVVYLSSHILPHQPAVAGPYAGTGRAAAGGGTLERTSAHELGHSMSLPHPPGVGLFGGNLMHQTGHAGAGLAILPVQVNQIITQLNAGLLNQGQQS